MTNAERAAAIADRRAELARVQASIDAQTGADGMASFSTQGTSIVHAPLAELRATKAILQGEIKALTNGSRVRNILVATRG